MKDAPGIEVGMIEELHGPNNRGIVPKKFSKMREDPDSISYLGKGRLGLMGPDVEPQVQEMLDRADLLIDQEATGDVSRLRHEVEAAKLHDLADRNKNPLFK